MRTTSYIKASLLAALVLFVGAADAARDGSGTYSLPTGNPVSSGTVISSTWANTTLSDISDALSDSLAKDGQTVPTANLPMGGFKHTGVADGSARNQYASVGQVQDFSVQTLGSISGTNTITGALSPAITSYVTGMLIAFVPGGNNTGATTLAVNGLSARSVVKWDGDALASGDLVSGVPALLATTSTTFLLLNPQSVDSTKLTGALPAISGASLTSLSAGNISSGTLAVARGGTGVTSSTGSGSVVLSASPTLTGTVTAATVNATTLKQGGSGVWTAANDGSGSGLDADTVDGSHASAFAASSHTHTMSSITDLPTLVAGTYTPTVTNVSNTSSGSAVAQYLRVGDTVTVSGEISITIDTVISSWRVSLPVSSDLSAQGHLAGIAAPSDAATIQAIPIWADSTNNAALFSAPNSVTTGARTFTFTFTYRVQ